MKVSTEIDNNVGYEKITQLVDNITLRDPRHIFLVRTSNSLKFEAARNLCSLFVEFFARFARNFKTRSFIILHRK
jgi:hypothetical protein